MSREYEPCNGVALTCHRIRELEAQLAALNQAAEEARGEIKDWKDGSDAEAYLGDEARAQLTAERQSHAATKAERDEALASAGRMRQRLLDTADRYMREDGTPGDLSSVWGWRDISKHLRDAALSTPAVPRVQEVTEAGSE